MLTGQVMDLGELVQGLHQGFGVGIAHEELEALREVLDVDQDGKVSVQEWTAALGLLDAQLEAEVWGRIVRMLRADFKTSYELFAFFDFNKDGVVSLQEFWQAMSYLSGRLALPISPEQAKWLYWSLDVDQTGLVNFAEWTSKVKQYW